MSNRKRNCFRVSALVNAVPLQPLMVFSVLFYYYILGVLKLSLFFLQIKENFEPEHQFYCMFETQVEILDYAHTYTEYAEQYLLVVTYQPKNQLKIDLFDIENGFAYNSLYNNPTGKYEGIKMAWIYKLFANEFNDDALNQKKAEKGLKKEKCIVTENIIGQKVQRNNGSYTVKKGTIKLCISLLCSNQVDDTIIDFKLFDQKEDLWSGSYNKVRKMKQKEKMEIKLKKQSEQSKKNKQLIDQLQKKFQKQFKNQETKHQDQLRKLKQHSKDLEAKLQQNVTIRASVAEESAFLKKFDLAKKNEIMYIGEYHWTQLLMKNVIPFNHQVSFKLKITKSPNNNVIFGVCDKTEANSRNSANSGKATSYQGRDGLIYGIGISQGGGFKVNEEVVMTVKLSEPKVTWTVDGVLKATSKLDYLKNENKTFVPYIQMQNPGDCVEWFGLMK